MGHFLLTLLLLPFMANEARIVTVASNAHYTATFPKSEDFDRLKTYENGGRYEAWSAYANSKVANILFTYELSRRLRSSGSSISALTVHPGVLRSGLWRHGELNLVAMFCICKTSSDGAIPVFKAAVSSRFESHAPPRRCEMVDEDVDHHFETEDEDDSPGDRSFEGDFSRDGLISRWCCCTRSLPSLPATYDDEVRSVFWAKSLSWAGLSDDEVPHLVATRDSRIEVPAPSEWLGALQYGPSLNPCCWCVC